MVDDEHPGKEVADNSELERALALLKPAASQINRDYFLFMAGRASVEARPGATFGRWMWPTATLLSSAAAVVLGLLLATRPEPVGSQPDSVKVATDRSIAPNVRDTGVRETGNAVTENSANQHDQPPDSAGADSTGWGLAQSSAPADSSQALPSRETARELAEGSTYPRLRTFVLAYGINALPEPAPIQASAIGPRSEDEPRTQLEMLRQSRNGDRKSLGRFGGPADSAG
jgi:hypothetical protein